LSWSLVPEAIGIFADNFGEYPFINEKYGHANFNWGGAMEHQTMSSMSGVSGFGWAITVHELAHQWWGDMITCGSWHDIWLNEGWASYAEALYYLEVMGWSHYRSYMNNMAYRGGGTIYVEDTTDVWSIFDGNLSYDKGAWVVHMLRGVLGEEAFFDGVDAYYHSAHQYGSATTEDFKNVFEAATGVELDWFFDEWIYGTYVPHYRYSYGSVPSDTGGYDVFVMVRQIQTTNPQVFHMPLDIVVNFGPGDNDTVVCPIASRRELFKFNYPDDITSVDLDPADWVLKSRSLTQDYVFITTMDGELPDGFVGEPYAEPVGVYGGSTDLTFEITSGALPDGLTIDPEDGLISGLATSPGEFGFTVHVLDNINLASDEVALSLTINANACCGLYYEGYTGNVNCSEDGLVTLSDITGLIDHIYISKQELCCHLNGNTNGSPDWLLTLDDITRLIDHVYISRAPTALCP
jgi:hypothetical protein